jgi:gliding motility-associated-like protein
MNKLVLFLILFLASFDTLFSQSIVPHIEVKDFDHQIGTISALSIGKENIDGIKVKWNTVPNAVAYQIALNDGKWITTNETSYTKGQTSYHSKVKIRTVFADGTTSQPVEAMLLGNCQFSVSITSLSPPSCYGLDDGQIFIGYAGTSSNGTTPVLSYQIDSEPPVNQPVIGSVTGGNHILIAHNLNDNCKDTLIFFMPQPDSIKIDVVIDTATCANGNLGSFTAQPSGGTAPFTYYWNTFPGTTTPKISNVLGGITRNIIITDDHGCKKNRNITMPNSTGILATATIDSIKCYGQKNGKITINTPPGAVGITYKWTKNGTPIAANTKTISNLDPAVYKVTLTDGKTCSSEYSFPIVEPKPLSIPTTVTFPGCQKTDGEIVTKGKGGIAPYTYAWNFNNATTPTISNIGSGTYKLTITDKNSCKLDSTYIIPPSNNINVTVKATNISCFNKNDGEISITIVGNNNLTYKWDDPAKQFTSTAANLSPGTYNVTLTDISGCTLVKTADVNKVDSISLNLTPTTAKCFNSTSESILANISGGNGNFLLKWSNGEFGNSITKLSPGSYSVVATDDKGCSVTKFASISSPSALKFSILQTVDSKCFGDNKGEANVSVVGGAGNISYKWNDPNGQISKKITNLSAGKYKVVATDVNGCSIDSTLTVKEPTKIENILTVKNPKCNKGVDAEINTKATGGTGTFTYNWENLLAKTPAIQNINAGFYQVSITDSNKCVLVDTVTLINPAKLILKLDQIEKSCAGLSNGAAVIDVIGGVPNYKYQWDDKNLSTTKSINKIAKGVYNVTVEDANKCIVSDAITITEFDSIVANVITVKPTCFGDKNGQIAVNFIKGGAGNGDLTKYDYKWNTTPFQSTVAASNLLGGKNYEVKITDNTGCNTIAKIFLPQPKEVTITQTVKDAKCFESTDGEIKVEGKSDNTTFAYAWSHDSNIIDDTAPKLIAGIYTVTATDDKGCFTKKDIIVKEPTALEIDSKTVKNNRCFGEEKGEITLLVKGGTPSYTYKWSNGEKLNKLTNLKATALSVTITDKNGCALEQKANIGQPAELGMQLTNSDVTCFGGKNGKINITGSGGSKPYLYSQNGSVYNGKNLLVGLAAGSYQIFLKDQNGCITNEEIGLEEPEIFSVKSTPDTAIYYGKTLTLGATSIGNQGKVNFIWTSPSSEAINCTKCDDPIITPKTSMTIFLKAIDEKGCSATGSTNIQIIRSKDVFVPTGFTPNFDDENDKLVIHGREGTKVLYFRVFDRWGELMFENTNFDINCTMCGWDGTFRGALMPSGVYAWMTQVQSINGEINIIKGNTTLIR